MTDPKLISWYKNQLDKKVPTESILNALKESGYTQEEISQLISEVETIKPTSTKGRKLAEVEEITIDTPLPERKSNLPEYKEVNQRHPTKKPLNGIIKKEAPFFQKAILLGALAIGLLLIIFFVFLFSGDPTIKRMIDPDPVHIDGLSPIVTITTSHPWVSAGNINVSCSDIGIDFSSGCNNQSYLYYLSTIEECPQTYTSYIPAITPIDQGFLCVAAKDIEGNTGYSQPIDVKFDVYLPQTNLTEHTEWIENSVTIDLTDSDQGSGLDICYYSIQSTEPFWQERACNMPLELDTSSCSQGEEACTLQAYAIDLSGNKGDTKETKLNIDFEKPRAEFITITSTKQQSGKLIASNTIEIIGIASDPNFKQYTLEWIQNTETSKIITSDQKVEGDTLGSLDTTKLPDKTIILVLLVEDLAGKTEQATIEIKISNTEGNASCEENEEVVCSWLHGICAQSIQQCINEEWSLCNYIELEDYENPELTCNDGIDNDCDGKIDCEVGFKDPDCDCSGAPNEISCVGGNQLTGDINDDGTLDDTDIHLILSVVNGSINFIGSELCCIDVNNDLAITEADATRVNGTILGMYDCFQRGYSCSLNENCLDGKDNDCDGLVDCESGYPDPDCAPCGDCYPECNSGETQCIESNSTFFICNECDEDACLDWCGTDCSDCSCTCGAYTTGNENEVVDGCLDGIDNDCDGKIDCQTGNEDLDCACP
ncbi:hypothetical protein K8R43_00505 [archaeon]|nr:hypothetical protein [archaeon]